MPDQPPIFITGRFRSGSTLLWQIYHESRGYRAYYEPCHDNLLAHIRCTPPMQSHCGVRDYWGAYRRLDDELWRVHRPEFGLTRLMLMPDDRFLALKLYIEFLIEEAQEVDLVPVLQFNRVDFRLPWLRARFPEARLIHIWRDVRESYASMVWHLVTEELDNPGRGNVYDLLEWCTSLSSDFPFLIGEPGASLYERHYYLWKLSLLMAKQHCDLSISFDGDIQKHRGRAVDMLIDLGCLDPKQRGAAVGRIVPVETRRWALLHDSDWFEAIEERCEQTLDSLGLNAEFGRTPLRDIRRRHAAAWSEVAALPRQRVIDQMMVAYSRQRSEVTRLLHEVRSRTPDEAKEQDLAFNDAGA